MSRRDEHSAIQVPGFRSIAEVASGASGTVFRAEQEALAREVALKVLSPGLFDAAETRARFLREAKLQAQLSHPNLVTLYDAGFAGGRPYLAMEWIDGGTLRELLDREAPLPLERAVRLAEQIASGLAQAHAHGIVHRDLKPENVLVTRDGVAKIADFGLAKGSKTGSASVRTATGVVLGTPGYISPEAIRGDAATAASDVYAFGAILYEAIAGQPAFPRESLGETLQAQLDGRARELGAATPPELERLVRECLSMEPGRRPSSVALAELLTRVKTVAPKVAPRGREAARGRSDTVVVAAPKPASRQSTRTVPAQRSGPSRLWVPLLLCVIAMAAGAVMSSRKPEPAVTQPEPPRRAALPSIVRIAAGLTRAQVLLDAPMPREGQLSYGVAGVPMDRASRVKAGMTRIPIEGLVPDTEYSAKLAEDGPEVPFRTLVPLGRTPIAMIHPVPRDADNLCVQAHGDEVFALWRSPKDGSHILRCRESFDGGATWTATRAFVEGNFDLAWPSAIAMPAGLAVFWSHLSGKESKLSGALRPRSSESWTPVEGLPIGNPGHRLVASGERTIEMLVGNDGRPASWTKIELGSSAPAVWRTAFAIPEGTLSWELLQAEGRRVAFLKTDRSDERRELFWTSTGDPALGEWTPVRRLIPTEPVVGRFDAAADGSRIVVVCTIRETAHVVVSEDAGRTFSTPRPLAPGTNLRLPGLVFRDGLFNLLLIDCTQNGLVGPLQRWTSRDGKGWKMVEQRKLNMAVTDELAACSTASGLLVLLRNSADGIVAIPM